MFDQAFKNIDSTMVTLPKMRADGFDLPAKDRNRAVEIILRSPAEIAKETKVLDARSG